ncbi:MAG TPA: aminotransferase class V-fold PLP-dependent enzyme [Pyrinomonadaceae bacterium]|nr:aminotransferase class V-fold PLP-dependent enzyme [Pyrinomonadaceae bacterium]
MIDDFVEQHRQLGKAVAEIVNEHIGGLADRRVTPEATPPQLEKLFDEPLPEKGISIDEILARFRRDVAPHAMGVPSPRYFGQFNPTPLPIAVWADVFASMLNQNAGAWRNGPTSAMIEARVIRWLCDLLDYGSRSFGTLASGGSEANLIALKCARDAADSTRDLVVYASEQCHYSIDKSVDILGMGRNSLRKIPTDDRFHIRVDALREQIARDREQGYLPACIVGVAGTTSMGVIDPIEELASIARENGCWYHVDAAYGAPLAFSPPHKHKLRGIELADSITFDPHKWMFVPFSCGAVLVRDGGRVLRDAFDMSPEYLSEDRGGADVEFDFFRYGQMGTRRFNSLKLWMAIKFMGREGYARTVERQIELTKYLANRIDALSDFERLGEVETAVCCFRHKSGADQRLQQIIEREGEVWLTTTVLRGRRALRVNVNSFLTEKRHIDQLVAQIEKAAATL